MTDATCAGVDIRGTLQPLQQHKDLFRLYPALLGAPEQAASSASAAAPGNSSHSHTMEAHRRWDRTAVQQLPAADQDTEQQQPCASQAAIHLARQQMPEGGSIWVSRAEQGKLEGSCTIGAMDVEQEPCVFSTSPKRRQYRRVIFEETHAGSLGGSANCSPAKPGKERALSCCGHQRRLF